MGAPPDQQGNGRTALTLCPSETFLKRFSSLQNGEWPDDVGGSRGSAPAMRLSRGRGSIVTGFERIRPFRNVRFLFPHTQPSSFARSRDIAVLVRALPILRPVLSTVP